MFLSMGHFSYRIFDENKKKLNHVNQNMCIAYEKMKKLEKNHF